MNLKLVLRKVQKALVWVLDVIFRRRHDFRRGKNEEKIFLKNLFS